MRRGLAHHGAVRFHGAQTKRSRRVAHPPSRHHAWGIVGILVFAQIGGAGEAIGDSSDEAGWDRVAAAPRAFGDAGGARSRLERMGVQLRLFYDQYLSGKPSKGGAEPDAGFGHSGSYDFFAQADLDALVGWRGATMLLHVKGQYDRSVNGEVGALSAPIDDADFDEPIYVDELWLQQTAWSGRLRLRLGFAEQQTIFDRNAYANSEDRQFLTTFLDNNAVVPLPNGLGASLIVAPTSWVEVAIGLADADNEPREVGIDTAFDGWSSLTGYVEAAFEGPWTEQGLPGRYRVGVFVDGRAQPDFRTGSRDRGHVGAWLSFDQRVLASGSGFGELGVFARAGYADPDVGRVTGFWSVVFESTGLLPGRGEDVLGFGVYQTIGSPAYRDAVDPDFRRETGLELYYAVRALGWLVLTPDLQLIVDPDATGAQPDVWVGTLRMRVTF